jgi:hypothetical protein
MLPRLLALLLIALLLAPHPLVVQRRLPVDRSQAITAASVAVADRRVGAVRIVEAWHLDSRNSDFGAVSALALGGDRPFLTDGDRRFLLAGDNSMIMRLTLARDGRVSNTSIRPLWLGTRASRKKSGRDLESLTTDRTDGRVWIGFEHEHRLMRFAPGLRATEGEVIPAAMRRWNANGGAEALVRFSDGRILVMAESSGGPGGGKEALLFDRDPVGDLGAVPLRFAYDSEGKGRVTDAAALPDGRVLIHRDTSLSERWISTLAVADPARIRSGVMWRSIPIARFAWPGLNENFEGIAVSGGADGVTIWMASDDNLAAWQRTLLLRLLWDGTSIANGPDQL